jgi:hypothetical protein
MNSKQTKGERFEQKDTLANPNTTHKHKVD